MCRKRQSSRWRWRQRKPGSGGRRRPAASLVWRAEVHGARYDTALQALPAKPRGLGSPPSAARPTSGFGHGGVRNSWLYPNRTLDYLPSRSFIEIWAGSISISATRTYGSCARSATAAATRDSDPTIVQFDAPRSRRRWPEFPIHVLRRYSLREAKRYHHGWPGRIARRPGLPPQGRRADG